MILFWAAVPRGQYVDWHALNRTCEEQLDRTAEIIARDAFSRKLDKVISAAKEKLSSNGIIYYTGYAKFFAEDISSDCDSVTWTL
ncbi:hypothetical protein BDV11DRAFT_186678 [Aspergillus similis]